MMLAAAQGSQLQLQCEGRDEAQALNAIEKLFADYFDEGE
jgi:phosphotransferase system HPr (HPr) family protein